MALEMTRLCFVTSGMPPHIQPAGTSTCNGVVRIVLTYRMSAILAFIDTQQPCVQVLTLPFHASAAYLAIPHRSYSGLVLHSLPFDSRWQLCVSQRFTRSGVTDLDVGLSGCIHATHGLALSADLALEAVSSLLKLQQSTALQSNLQNAVPGELWHMSTLRVNQQSST